MLHRSEEGTKKRQMAKFTASKTYQRLPDSDRPDWLRGKMEEWAKKELKRQERKRERAPTLLQMNRDRRKGRDRRRGSRWRSTSSG